MSETAPLRVAIVGAGWMGAVHAAAVSSSGDQICLVVDQDLDRAELLARQYQATTSNDLTSCRCCDAAVVCSPSYLHLQHAEDLAQLGVAILLEKPHRLPHQSVASLRQYLQSSGSHFQVGMTTRYHNGIQALRQAVTADIFGDIFFYQDNFFAQLDDTTVISSWYFDPVFAGGGVQLTNGVHLIDRCQWILSDRLLPQQQRLMKIIAGHQVEDYSQVYFLSEQRRCTVVHTLLWSQQPLSSANNILLLGSKGNARIGDSDWLINSTAGTSSGSSADSATQFRQQWLDFRHNCRYQAGAGENAADLESAEATIGVIEQIYAKQAVAT